MKYWSCYKGFEALLKSIKEYENELIYVNFNSYKENPLDCDYYVVLDPSQYDVSDDDLYIDENGMEQWKGLQDKNLTDFLEIKDIEGIIYNFTETYEKTPTLNDIIKAVKYYYENDAFI